MTITTQTTIADIIAYIKQDDSAQAKLNEYKEIIDNNDISGSLSIYTIIEQFKGVSNHNYPALYLAMAMLSTGYPKNGSYTMSWWRWSSDLESIGLSNELNNTLSIGSFDITEVALDDLDLFTDRIKTREIRRRNSEKRKADLKDIKLNEFSFKLFQKSIEKTGKQITIKDGLEYLTKLYSVYSTAKNDKTTLDATHELFFKWAGFIYSIIRNPNDAVMKTIYSFQDRDTYAKYWHYLPVVNLDREFNPEIAESLMDHKNVTFTSATLSAIWETYFKGNFRNTVSELSTYIGYHSILVSSKAIPLFNGSWYNDSSITKSVEMIKILTYLQYKDEVLKNSVWLTNTINILRANLDSRTKEKPAPELLQKTTDALRAQRDFINYWTDTQEVPYDKL